ncbi:hypothetical protein KKI95_00005 [Xenorhabdus bovienii]|uniref:hypothetical protein n=1 Tax=Xenorhabdus bovienii TaxID=40576 RepID=UPI0023B29F89|nr:hypothetical protein [Xenorhabdus bovienii]MDE9434370.1 hypothetical protein [Xenorhabdus bovienii]MDE9495572.1 hypothetical protein [Xenorhabdus bovienii]MDE9496710.1 hypothetical protein [Xenorhabdus bovienii]MDE9503989.1 hypothetical protein [Xenorhabdus bovienii]MDE9519195.1 hypothetical protein [Xenorhabdus bovienii]
MPMKLINVEKINEVFVHLNESLDNHSLYAELVNGNYITDQIKGLSLAPGYRMVRVDGRFGDLMSQSHFELALVNDVSKEVVYYNRVIIQPDVVLNCRPVTQILVWRTLRREHRAVLHELAGLVFFGYLLERYNVIVSDMNQTHDGLSFWQSRMYDALAYNMYVYAYDMVTCELRRILTEDDVGRQESWLWGNLEHYQNRLAIISKSELPTQ